MTNPIEVMQKWSAGDFVYGAIRTTSAPSGVHHLMVNGREYPVARLNISGDDYSIAFWAKRSDPFPEPIRGFNN